MKIKPLALVAIIIGLFCGNAKADNVDIQTAKQLGAYYFSVATGAKTPVSADNMKLAQQFDNPTLCVPAMYAFNVEGNGFVVVSASDAVEPILAYSPEGNLDPENLNPACKYMLDSYAAIISETQNKEAKASKQVKALWNQLDQQTLTVDLSKAGVLIQTKWDQGENTRPSYNALCPTINGQYPYAGCVAVAMAQIIKYWEYPVKGGKPDSNTVKCYWNNQTIKYKFTLDSNKFVYDSMPTKITPYSEWNYIRAIGKLMFACGVAAQMQWGLDGSGTQSSLVPNALTWFRYNDAKYELRYDRYGVQQYTDAEWISMLRTEIVDSLRPIYYSGYDGTSGGRDAGHAWVVCGASAADDTKYYINWGWGGSANGFFTLAPQSAIQTAAGYTFNSGHAMVYKIYPSENTNPVSIDENTAYSVSPAYPNPATDHMIVPVDLPNSAAMGIYSVDGKMIENIVIPAGTKEYRVNLQGYAPGTYVYRLNGKVYKFAVL